jgi:hypothetical protein
VKPSKKEERQQHQQRTRFLFAHLLSQNAFKTMVTTRKHGLTLNYVNCERKKKMKDDDGDGKRTKRRQRQLSYTKVHFTIRPRAAGSRPVFFVHLQHRGRTGCCARLARPGERARN